MSKEKIELDLQRIDGQRCMYNGRNIKVESARIESDFVVVVTDQREIKIPRFSAVTDLKLFKVIDASMALVPKAPPAKLEVIGVEVMKSLKDTLLENIENVKKDKGFIPQAAQINKDVNTLVNMAKHELQLIKTTVGN